ncbi:MAG: hypothetical protein ACLFVB_06955 [Thermoplasmata archaeon]
MKLTRLEMIKWENWPLWLKGFFILWPSIGPAFYFIQGTPEQSGDELVNIWYKLEYQTELIYYFIGLWTINLVVLGGIWIFAGMFNPRETIEEKKKVRRVLVKKVPEKKLNTLKKKGQ